MQRVKCYLPGVSDWGLPSQRQNGSRQVLSQCLGHGAVLPDTGKAQLPHGAFRDGIVQDRPAKLGSRMDWLAVGIFFKQTAVGARGCSYGFGCHVGCDLVGRGELI